MSEEMESEEFLPVWQAAGFDSGACRSKAEVHAQGDWHPTVQIWLRKDNQTGSQTGGKAGPQYLLQLRAAEKDTFPCCWDVSVAGHVSAGERLEQAALRELQEELGIQLPPEQLQFLFRMPYYGQYSNGLTDCEWQHVYLAELPPDWRDEVFQLQQGEVSALRWVSWAELKRDWAYFAGLHGSGTAAQWQGFEVQGFALHRHYPKEANAAAQLAPRPQLTDNHYWARLYEALKD